MPAAASPWQTDDWSAREADGGGAVALAQGDLLPGCWIPALPDDFTPPADGEDVEMFAEQLDLIVLTQSCDLANPGKRLRFVTLCPVYGLEEFAAANEKFGPWTKWNDVRAGKYVALHMLASQHDPEDNLGALIVDFRQPVSLPVGYLRTHAASLGAWARLRSPYLEHFSQAFARFFMRVGLPNETVPKFIGPGPAAGG